MSKAIELLDALTMKQLESLTKHKKDYDTLIKRKKALEKELGSVLRGIMSVQKLVEASPADPKMKKKVFKKKVIKKRVPTALAKTKTKHFQPTLEFAISKILRTSRKTMTVKQIEEALMASGYKSTSANFPNTLRVKLYTSDAFKKVGKGKFKI